MTIFEKRLSRKRCVALFAAARGGHVSQVMQGHIRAEDLCGPVAGTGGAVLCSEQGR